MRFSRASRKVTIEEQSVTVDTLGSEVVTWSTFATVWAERKNLRGNEGEAANQRLAEAETVFTVRYSQLFKLLDARFRVVQQNEVFDIMAVVPVKGDRPDRLELWTKRDDTAAVLSGIGSMEVGADFQVS